MMDEVVEEALHAQAIEVLDYHDETAGVGNTDQRGGAAVLFPRESEVVGDDDDQVDNDDNQQKQQQVQGDDTDTKFQAALKEMKEEELSLGSLDDETPENDDDDDAETPAAAADNPRMQLSEQERQWAWAIKRAIEEDPDLDDACSDFLCAQLAIIDQADVESALERAKGLQYLAQEYGIHVDNSSLGQARRAFEAGMNKFPGFFLSISFHQDEFSEGNGNYTIVIDKTKMSYTDTTGGREDPYPIWCRAAFYQFHAVNPDFDSIREGTYILVECDGFDTKKQFGLSVFRKMWTELGLVYPINILAVKHYHTGVLVNLLVSMAKRVLPQALHKRFEIGHVCPAGKLSDIYYNSPNPQTSQQRLLKQFTKAIKLRYHNEATFSLSTTTTTIPPSATASAS